VVPRCETLSKPVRTLFRPVGVRELELVLDRDAREFPPRLLEQPFFYPVLNDEYARQIARDWNTRDPRSGHAGFVTAFDLPDEYLAGHEVRVVGGREHQEFWIPAGELTEFNRQLRSRIRLTEAFYGPLYEGDGAEHFSELAAAMGEPVSFLAEVVRGWRAILFHHGYWTTAQSRALGVSDERRIRVLDAVAEVWPHPDLPLPRGHLVP
jgi:hypothetical protein